jgi:protein-L-isoaspartate(D-aspartate) O-methyltransferase
MEPDFSAARELMVKQQLQMRGIKDSNVLAAMGEVPRHRFVPESMQSHAYADGPLPIGQGQTISQPYIVALMAEAAEIKKTDIVLEIGTGSGYAAAILSKMANEVFTIERIPALASVAETIYGELGYGNIHIIVGDGTLGCAEKGPFDAIIVTAGAPNIPEALKEQLKIGGRLVIPVGDSLMQNLIRIRKVAEGQFTHETLEYVRFVPLIGQQGW